MNIDLNTLISLGSAIISLASFFGLFYKMKFQIEEMEKKQEKIYAKLDDLVEITFQNKADIKLLKSQRDEIVKDIDELKGDKYGRQIGTRTSQGS